VENHERSRADYFGTQRLNQDPLENTFGAIHFHCDSNNNPTVGLFVVAPKTSTINGLLFRGLHGTNCKEDDKSSGLPTFLTQGA
jgi:hypothetical protein